MPSGARSAAATEPVRNAAAAKVSAAALDLDPDHVTYTPLGELATATEKARRDAPAIAVCEV